MIAYLARTIFIYDNSSSNSNNVWVFDTLFGLLDHVRNTYSIEKHCSLLDCIHILPVDAVSLRVMVCNRSVSCYLTIVVLVNYSFRKNFPFFMWTFAFQCCFGAAWNCDKSYWHISILYMCHLLWCGQHTLASVCWFTSSLGLTEMFIDREESNCADRCIRTIIQNMEILRFTVLYARKLPTCKQSYLQLNKWYDDNLEDRRQMTTTYENVDKLDSRSTRLLNLT